MKVTADLKAWWDIIKSTFYKEWLFIRKALFCELWYFTRVGEGDNVALCSIKQDNPNNCKKVQEQISRLE